MSLTLAAGTAKLLFLSMHLRMMAAGSRAGAGLALTASQRWLGALSPIARSRPGATKQQHRMRQVTRGWPSAQLRLRLFWRRQKSDRRRP